jgi:hypothetical protein
MMLAHKRTDPLIIVHNLDAPYRMRLNRILGTNVFSVRRNSISFPKIRWNEFFQTGWMKFGLVIALRRAMP